MNDNRLTATMVAHKEAEERRRAKLIRAMNAIIKKCPEFANELHEIMDAAEYWRNRALEAERMLLMQPPTPGTAPPDKP